MERAIFEIVLVVFGVALGRFWNRMAEARPSVSLIDKPLWQVHAGSRPLFVERVGLRCKNKDGREVDVDLKWQRLVSVKGLDPNETTTQAAVHRIDPHQTLYFHSPGKIVETLDEGGVQMKDNVVRVRAFVRVQGQDKPLYAKKWCVYNVNGTVAES